MVKVKFQIFFLTNQIEGSNVLSWTVTSLSLFWSLNTDEESKFHKKYNRPEQIKIHRYVDKVFIDLSSLGPTSAWPRIIGIVKCINYFDMHLTVHLSSWTENMGVGDEFSWNT